MNTDKKNIIVTGGSGFIGTYALPLFSEQFNVQSLSLRNQQIDLLTLTNVNAIVHLAGIAHQMNNPDPQIYFDINRDLTISFAEKAKKSGIKHFIFISTIKVYGDHAQTFYNDQSECNPTDPYGQSKYEAEMALLKMSSSEFVVSIIRPPLVYGPGAKGNLERMITLISKYKYLPLAKITNQRSMVQVGNLTDLIVNLLKKPVDGVFIAGDAKPHSTSNLANEISLALNSNNKFFRMPFVTKQALKKLKPNIYSRLFDDLIIDNSNTNRILNFSPKLSLNEGVFEMVKYHKGK